MFHLAFREKTFKILKRVNREQQLKINAALDVLRLEKLSLLDIKKIEGTQHGYRLRVGRWRILISLLPKAKRAEIVDIFVKKGAENYQKRKHLLK